ncbi:MAG: putative ATP-dependent RNA helicase dhr2 [Bathelium mastoideum]|nr:MAG: putative ATP-dependent RNA helicase dhr2 [Bathelium mastoideum]
MSQVTPSRKRKREFENGSGLNPHVTFLKDRDGKLTTSTPGGPQPKSSHPNVSPKNGIRGRVANVQSIQIARQNLPIWNHQESIREALSTKNVLILAGETGSGKSTQVPQFLLDAPWCDGQIAITQPRRVAAITLARRVAAEMGSTVGSSSPASKVGYSVRFDNSTSPAMRIKYLTEGMLLQELLRDPWLKSYSVVVVDEVHERSVNVDLILGFLRMIVTKEAEGESKRQKPLKLVIMSATAETEALVQFCEKGFENTESQCDQKILDGEDDDCSETSWSGISSSDSEETPNDKHKLTTQPKKNALNDEDTPGKKTPPIIPAEKSKSAKPIKEAKSITIMGKVISLIPDRSKSQYAKPVPVQTNGHDRTINIKESQNVSTRLIQGRQYPVEVFHLPEPTLDIVYSAVKAVFQVHFGEPLPGDVLVFLTGQDTVESAQKLVNDHAREMSKDMPKILALTFFAALSPPQQAQVFLPAKGFTRKVILSTNIAETSVTIPGVRYVIDAGKAKQKHFHNRLGLDSLLSKTISRSSAIQRQGRAGREMPGKCWRLYTKDAFQQMEKAGKPEILRCDVSSALLFMKACGISDVTKFPLLDPLPREALSEGLLHLLEIDALTDTGSISPIGSQMSRLPLTPSLARVIVAGARIDGGATCLLETIDIVSALSVENVFVNPSTEEQREEADASRHDIVRRQSDLLTLLATVRGFAAEQVDRKAWAVKRFVSVQAMRNVMRVRKQLRSQCEQLKLVPAAVLRDEGEAPPVVSDEVAAAILKCFAHGFAANSARLMPDGSYKTLFGDHSVAIHPSSVLFGKKVPAIMFAEFVFTNKSYARGVSAVELAMVVDVIEKKGMDA